MSRDRRDRRRRRQRSKRQRRPRGGQKRRERDSSRERGTDRHRQQPRRGQRSAGASNRHPRPQGSAGPDTRATSAGWLPDSVGAALTGLVCLAILVLGARLGHSVLLLALLCVAGVGAALGVRAGANRSNLAVFGVIPLWLTALLFAGVAASLVDASGRLATLVIAGAAMLGPFGVVGNTVRSYGEGTGRTLLGRYLRGTLVLAGLVLVYGVVLAALSNGVGGARGGFGSVVPDALSERVLVAAVLYPALVWFVDRANRQFPAEVLVSFPDLERVEDSRSRIQVATRTGWQVLGGLTVVVIVAGTAALMTDGSEEKSGALSVIADLGFALVSVATAGPLLWLAGVGLLATGTVVVPIYVVRKYGTTSATVLAQTVGVPVAVFGLTVIATGLLGDRLPLERAEGLADAAPATDSSIHQLVVEFPTLLVAVLCTVAILASAVVFSVPTMVAGAPAIDDSLAGLAAAILAVVAFVVAATVAGEHPAVVVAGVAVVAIVWELGEYATVAVGELRTDASSSQPPRGLSRLASIHAVATAGIAFIGGAVAATVAVVTGGVSLPGGFAVLAIILSVLGLAGLVLLLTG